MRRPCNVRPGPTHTIYQGMTNSLAIAAPPPPAWALCEADGLSEWDMLLGTST